MTARPWVRIVVPSYNQGAFIRATLDSLLAQDYPALEVVVRDGGSTDGTLDVLRSVKDDRLTWVSERDAGQGDAILKGLAAPGAPYVWWNWLASDDVLATPRAISLLVERATVARADVAFGAAVYIDETGRPLRPYPVRPVSRDELFRGCPICQPSALIRRDASERAGGLRPDWRFVLDYELWVRMLASGARFVALPEVLSHYRIHDASKTSSMRATMYSEIFRLFAERGERVGKSVFDAAIGECLMLPRFRTLGPTRGAKSFIFRLARRSLFEASRVPKVQEALGRAFREPGADHVRALVTPEDEG